ncbi:MAG: TetR/AcrR family transcriptional regulator [Bdellovibrionales bacterium]|nr:TetR/AcrR family transcriptional regulator [Bdellovibrionales bacterium]
MAKRPARPKTKSAGPPPPGRRERIVAAALDAFVANGIAPTTMRDVAKRADVDPPLIHYYFKDIESLHLAVIALALEELKEYSLREAEKHPERPERWMAEYIKAPLTWIRDRPERMFLWVYFYTLAAKPGPGPFRSLNDQIRKVGRDRIRMKVFEGVERGVFHLPDGLTAAEAALEIQSWMTGSAIIFATENEIGYERSVRTLHRRIFSFLGVADSART